MKSDFDDTILNEDIDALLDDEAPEPSNDEDAALDTSNLSLEIASTFSYTHSVDEQKEATNQEGDANENDTNMRQITQSKKLLNHKSCQELLSMELDFDNSIMNEDIDDLLDDESLELFNDEGAALDNPNLGLETVNSFSCKDSVD